MPEAPLYPSELLQLATEIPFLGKIEKPDASARKVSRICGSSIEVDVKIDGDGLVKKLAIRPQACAIGQAAAAVFTQGAIGKNLEELREAQTCLEKILQGEDCTPPIGFERLHYLAAVKNYPARWPSARLTIAAMIEATEQAMQTD